MTLLDLLPIQIDTEMCQRAFREVLTLARSEGLTTCDANYLELAVCGGLPLATRDKAVRDAAKRLRIPALPVC